MKIIITTKNKSKRRLNVKEPLHLQKQKNIKKRRKIPVKKNMVPIGGFKQKRQKNVEKKQNLKSMVMKITIIEKKPQKHL